MYLTLAREPFPALVRAGVYYISCNCLLHSSVFGVEAVQCIRKACCREDGEYGGGCGGWGHWGVFVFMSCEFGLLVGRLISLPQAVSV